jgi:predicted DCC family thiol-disulfide oxidoreductase YuxK
MKSLTSKWNEYWFEPATADNLGLARILVYGSMAIFYLASPYLFPVWGWHETFNEWGGVSSVFWRPIWLFQVLHLPQFSVQTIAIIDAAWKVSLVFSAFGLFTRFSNGVSFVLCVYLFGIPNCFGKTHHLDILLLWSFLIFTCSRCGDSWSIDRLIKTAREGSDRREVSGEYTWPIRLIWVIMAMIYFEAGFSKLRHSGIAWITGDSMATFLLQSQYHITDAEPVTNWGLWMSAHPWSSHLLAFMGLSLELSYPLAVFSKRLRYFVMAGGMMMQTGIAFLMGPNFYQMILCQLLWLPLDRIVYWFLGLFAGEKVYTVIFDGSCGLCKKTIAVVKSLDLLSKVEYLDAMNQWPEIQRRFPNLDQTRCLEDMYAVSRAGKVRVGFEAYRGLARVLPLGWLTLPIFYFPGAGIIGKMIYRSVADNRHNGGCALPDSVGSATPGVGTSGKP